MNYNINKFIMILSLFVPISAFCQTSVIDSAETAYLLNKIKFDLNSIDENGMIGPSDGKRNIEYEFCIPLDRKKKREVSKIDPSVKFFSGPTGRSGCSGQYLCIGSGGSKETLVELAKLKYIKVINPCYYE